MHILLLQNDPCVRDLSAGAVRRYPRSSVYATAGCQYPAGRPALTEKWLIKVLIGRRMKKQIEEAAKVKDRAAFVFVSGGRRDDVSNLLCEYGFEFSVVDNLRPDAETLVQYVESRLDVAHSVAERIVEKSARYEPHVMRNVQMLSLVSKKKLTRGDIDKYLQDSSGVSFSYLYRFVLLGEGDYAKVAKLVYRYRTAPWVLSRFVIGRLKQDIRLYHEMMDGSLSKNNWIDYADKNRTGTYAVKQALALFESMTLEALYAKLALYESLREKGCVEFLLKGCKI